MRSGRTAFHRVPGLLPFFLAIAPALAAPQQVVLTSEAVVNTTDGSIWVECPTQDEGASGKKVESWLAWGEVKAGGDRTWQAVARATRCGSGAFDKASALSAPSLGTPYLIVDLERTPAVRSDGRTDLQATLEIRRFSSFDDAGRPVYTRSEQKRRFDLGAGGDAVVPLLSSLPPETDAFHTRDYFLQLGARVVGRETASYGAIAVTADIAAADIFLDGGITTRTVEGGPATLRNVRTGTHEVRVRDASGRVASKQVLVEKDKTAEVALNMLNLPDAHGELVPIGTNPQGGEEFWRRRDAAVVVRVPAGEFTMGKPEGEGEPADAAPRNVFISEFLMDKTEVTWRQFRKYLAATHAEEPPDPVWGKLDDYPVSGALFEEAEGYCSWVGGRLPTEAEWEKAARGPEGREYPWGNDWDPDRCNSIEGGNHRPEGVGRFPQCLSPYGIIDMAGGVWEWTTDFYAPGYPPGPAKDPKGPAGGQERVLRGGSWLNMPTWLRTAHRQKNSPTWRNTLNGFRCVQSMPAQPGEGK